MMLCGPNKVTVSTGRGGCGGNFIVELYDDEGHSIALLANEIGEYEGSTAERIPADGLYVLDIVADGDWTVDVTD